MPDPNQMSVIMLAAGASTRMGPVNKLLAPWRGRPVLTAALAPLLTRRWREVIVVVGHEAERIAAVLTGGGPRLVRNPNYERGLGASIACGVGAASPEASGFLIALADMPAISDESADQLRQTFARAGTDAIVAPVYKGRRGHPVLFAADYRAELIALDGDVGARSVLRAHPSSVTETPVDDPGVLRDIDTPEDWRRFQDEDARRI